MRQARRRGISLALLASRFLDFLKEMVGNVGRRVDAAMELFSEFNTTMMRVTSGLKKLASPTAPPDDVWELL